jgi:putative transposase
MSIALVERALTRAVKLRRPPYGVVFHSYRGSQYTSKRFLSFLRKTALISLMGDVGAYCDNAVVVKFFSSLKHDWLLKVRHPTRIDIQNDVAAYINYYNAGRLNSTNDDLLPVNYEVSKIKILIVVDIPTFYVGCQAVKRLV